MVMKLMVRYPLRKNVTKAFRVKAWCGQSGIWSHINICFYIRRFILRHFSAGRGHACRTGAV